MEENGQVGTDQEITMQKEKLKKPMAPETGLVWSLLLSPIAGAIFWSINWKRLDRSKHIWWTIVSMVVVFILYFIAITMFTTAIPGLIIFFIWDAIMYLVQKRFTPPEAISPISWVGAGVFAVLGIVFAYFQH